MFPITKNLISRAYLAPINRVSVLRFSNSARLYEIETKNRPSEVSQEIPTQHVDLQSTQPAVIDEEEKILLQKVEYEKASQAIEELGTIPERDLARLQEAILKKVPQEKFDNLESELNAFLDEFAVKFDYSVFDNNANKQTLTSSDKEFPNLVVSFEDKPYSKQELFLRQLKHSRKTANLGATLQDTFKQAEEYKYPKSINSLTIDTLLAAGCHLGHATELYRPSTQPFIYGIYNGIHIIDLEKTLTYLKRACKVIQGVAEKGGLIVYLGTREGQTRSLEEAAERSGGFYVSSRWVPGTVTNCTEVGSQWEKTEVDLGDKSTNRELTQYETGSLVKPDLIVVLNPTENENALKEAMQTRVPTIGIIDTNTEPSGVTYPIPANDDSVRSTNLIIGVLSKAAETGRRIRIKSYSQYRGLQGIQN